MGSGKREGRREGGKKVREDGSSLCRPDPGRRHPGRAEQQV